MEGAVAAMFNTITDIAKVDVDPSLTRVMEIEGEVTDSGLCRRNNEKPSLCRVPRLEGHKIQIQKRHRLLLQM